MLSDVDFSVYLVCIFCGVLLGAVYAFYNKSILGSFVRSLIDSGCTKPESGKTLKELGFDKKPLLRFALRDGSSLSYVVKGRPLAVEVPEAEAAKEKKRTFGKSAKVNLDNMVYYLDPEKIEKAERTYDNQGTTVLSVALTAIVFFFVLAASYFIIPLIFDLGDSIRTSFGRKETSELVKITGGENYDFSDVIAEDNKGVPTD